MYNCVSRTVLGSSVGVLLGVILGGDTGWEERIIVVLEPGEAPVTSMGNPNDMRGRL